MTGNKVMLIIQYRLFVLDDADEMMDEGCNGGVATMQRRSGDVVYVCMHVRWGYSECYSNS
jgi:hypothetical protein